MYIILIVFAVGLAITLERFIYLSSVKSKNVKMWDQLFPMLGQGKFNQAMQAAKDSNSAIARIMIYGLSRATHSTNSEDIELAMEEGLMEIMPQLERRTPYLNAFANIATLLGLLGTILGLIKAFTAVASADPSQKADLLSASISVAMNTTAFGLMSGIPLLITHAVLVSKTGEIIDSLEMASVKTLNIISEAAKRQAG